MSDTKLAKKDTEEFVALPCIAVVDYGFKVMAEIQDSTNEDEMVDALEHFTDVVLALKQCEFLEKQRTGTVQYEMSEDLQEIVAKQKGEVRGKTAPWHYEMPEKERQKMRLEEIKKKEAELHRMKEDLRKEVGYSL